jgi:uncharacterized protein (TIGR00730 family)
VRKIAVFCGASCGSSPRFAERAQELGACIGAAHKTLIYGGGKAGLMGTVADATLAAGGRVVGVITNLLKDRELGHEGISELHVVETMHQRKMMMANFADAFVAMPGGLGTLDELFEILAWAQLGIHAKPVGLLNVDGFYNPLWSFLGQVEEAGFLRLDYRRAVVMDDNPRALLDRLSTGR